MMDQEGTPGNKNIQTQNLASMPGRRHRHFILFAAITFTLIIAATIIFCVSNNAHPTAAGMGTPSVKINGQMYLWSSDDVAMTLPTGFTLIGQVQNPESKNFTPYYFQTGDQVYMDFSNPYIIYIYTDFAGKEGQYRYMLFRSSEISKPMIYFNGNLYKYSDEFDILKSEMPWNKLSGYTCAGNVNSIIKDHVPSHDFESNLENSIGDKIYFSKVSSDIIYLEKPEEKVFAYYEMKKSK